ncbi:FMN-binding negative transcriptional regulator [Solibacillus sp. CAU 1738]|uniref:FMN-binding negative transcriptional regulator n=1 Tax=Solibacillus sp. CAU 1738 TaxID=3140363 RepID=UPI0032607337
MYRPAAFDMKEHTDMYKVIHENGFATLFSTHNGMPTATHLPLLLSDGNDYLVGHFAKANPQWRDMEGQTVLTVFHGPHCYISPSWYEMDQAVPTWNYIAVHVYGEVEFIEDDELIASYEKLISKYEKANSTYKLANVDPKMITNMNKAVQGFKIKITNVEGKAKLSQNHPQNRRELVIDALEKNPGQNEQQIANLMKEKT